MDECDQARVFNDFHRDLAISNRERPGVSETGESRETCLECGEPIPQARREAMPGCTLCIKCQTELEAEGK